MPQKPSLQPAYVRADTSFIIFQKPERQRKGKNPVTGFACESERYTFAGRKKRFVKRKSPFPEKAGNGQYLSFAGMFFKTGRDV